MMRQKSDSN
jgi:hypothetical protein